MSTTKVTWQSLVNPFCYSNNINEAMLGHVSGRSTDIKRIISGSQSAIIISGAPCIGKSVLLRYLKTMPDAEWSWRQETELAPLRDQFQLDQFYFVQIDLAHLELIKNVNEMLAPFIEQCIQALQQTQPTLELPSVMDIRGLRRLLRELNYQIPGARYFVMLDNIERLARPGTPFPLQDSQAQTLQEQGIALLNHSGAIRALVDMIDEFENFGVILSIQSLPRPKVIDQFSHVSADLARFITMTLQAFTGDDTDAFLQQEPESFGQSWAHKFRSLGGNSIFTPDEQRWIRTQAGTHPYLLQQFCFHAFYYKQNYASKHHTWQELQESAKIELTEYVNEYISTFLTYLWKRLQEALEMGMPETRSKLYEFVNSFNGKEAYEVVATELWDELGGEVRYILSSEGIVRSDLFQDVHYPGSLLRDYLLQKVNGVGTSATRGFWLILNRDGQREHLSLSELEYRLLKTLIQHPKRCGEEELMKNAWGRIIERPTFTQRMHHLRKKLKDTDKGEELIVNHYGGQYTLSHPEWIHLE